MVAAAYAYVNALNKLLVKREKTGARSADRRAMKQAGPGVKRAGAVLAGTALH